MSLLQIKIKLLHKDARIPELATPGSACFDVYAIASERVGGHAIGNIRTGISFEIPVGYELLVRPRSGLASQGIEIANSPGTLDSDYRGELKVLISNTLTLPYLIEKGDRIAQIAIRKTEKIQFLEVDELSQTERGNKGMGSTGI